ncbi:ATP-binding protein [Brachyspira catarrhinii]|uniref:ATP-binding protein n=1 Tax=Brachyspira catarrhinii TaxID=2528966 RepID=A0ABY2TRN3_9SPIR|nr:ATP-binding protein [Brachyspira catarrhinii]
MKKYILKNSIGEVAGLIKDICGEISGFIDEANVNLFAAALYEVAINAIEHGNLGISYETKKEWIEKNIYHEKLAELLKTEAAKNTFVEISLEIENGYITLIVRDEGEGFKPQKAIEKIKQEDFMRNSGRGMMMMKSYFDEIKYNETGNSITLLKKIK